MKQVPEILDEIMTPQLPSQFHVLTGRDNPKLNDWTIHFRLGTLSRFSPDTAGSTFYPPDA